VSRSALERSLGKKKGERKVRKGPHFPVEKEEDGREYCPEARDQSEERKGHAPFIWGGKGR